MQTIFYFKIVSAHGRLIEPPSRASMWRYGFQTPQDYNDHESYCGGFTRQWQWNSGKCGICGDAWDLKPPRPHEMGGKYGNNIIVRRYRIGAIIPVKIQLTANHRGYFEFRTCPIESNGQDVTQDCLNKYLLTDKNGTVRYYPEEGNRIFISYYKLPVDLKCKQCVFQWRYIAGNNWGNCDNGSGAVGCGPQEEFRACADIAIDNDEFQISTYSVKIPTTSSNLDLPFSTESDDYWLFNFVMAGTSLLVALTLMAFLYMYYNTDQVKTWLRTKRLINKQQLPLATPQYKNTP
ncbi:PREDICTED: uncharacterized protein LOC105363384 isoform X2 [Ceratosolen solmsi marchali]|uniref:Uncharacterized protein LOC105363384 isoform X2 n=1 Tax=Ceratosolen solmsi marchali TaxID=326594 RepID=A0AAJ6YJT9_9HYME|nr:PREDICTED: uncharacterized protein LOC105363384 isoform X2 [Ceratosolen solmsi marchali]